MSELAFNRIILEKNNQILAIIVVILLMLILILGVALTFSVNKKNLIVYEDSGQVISLKQSNFKLDESILEGFVRLITKEYFSFTAVSLPVQIEGIKQYLADAPKNSILKSYKKNEKTMQKDNVFHQFSIYEIQVTKKSIPYQVEVSGIKTIYANGNSKNIPAAYLLEIQRIKQTKINPYGLIVSKIIEKSKKKMEARK